MSRRRQRDRKRLAAVLAFLAWCLAASVLAHPSPGVVIWLAFGAGLVTGAALTHYVDQRRPRQSPRPGPRSAAAPQPASPQRAAAAARPRPSPRPGPGPALRAVPDAAALRADLAARADRVSTRIPAPENDREGTS